MKLEVKNLTTGYGDTKIIENLNLTIPEGKVTALIGANGCGKSTLLKTICRIIRPMDGDVLLDGKSIGSYGSRELAKRLLFCLKIQRHLVKLQCVNLLCTVVHRIKAAYLPVLQKRIKKL